MNTDLPHINLAVLGHAKCGKSTLLGRWMADIGALTASELERLEKDGHNGAKYSRVSDKFPCERQKEMTVDIHVRSCKTAKKSWTVIDVPGHRRYLRNAISGVCAADCILFVLDASPGVFEAQLQDSCLEEGVPAQTKEQLMLMYALGVKEIVVVVNKMDMCQYEQGRFEHICSQTITQMRKQGLAPDQVRFIPVASSCGSNLVLPAPDTMPWFRGSTLAEALEAVQEPGRPQDRPLRMPVQDVYRISGIGTVVCGRVEAGVLQEGATVVLAPSGIRAQVKSIELHQHTVDRAVAGHNVGVSLRGVSTKEVRRGMVLLLQDSSSNEDMKIQVLSFQAMVSVRRAAGVDLGYCATVNVHTAAVPCRFSRFISKLDKKTGTVIEENPKRLQDRDIGNVELEPLRPLFLDSLKECDALGRFVIQDLHQIVAFGAVKSVEKKSVGCRPGSLLASAACLNLVSDPNNDVLRGASAAGQENYGKAPAKQ